MLGKRNRSPCLQDLINSVNSDSKITDGANSEKETDKKSNQTMGFASASNNMGQKRVKFNQKQDKVYEFEVVSSEDDECLKKPDEPEDGSISIDSEEYSEEICGSDDEDMEKGLFFEYIDRVRER